MKKKINPALGSMAIVLTVFALLIFSNAVSPIDIFVFAGARQRKKAV